MSERILRFLKQAAEQLRLECESLSDALQYTDELVSEADDEFDLGYEKGTDSHGCLYEAADRAIRVAFEDQP